MSQETILAAINNLPEHLQTEVLHYAEFLAQKKIKSVDDGEPKKKRRSIEKPAGIFQMPLPDDFDAPLEDFKEYM
jgi:hypothetical protein